MSVDAAVAPKSPLGFELAVGHAQNMLDKLHALQFPDQHSRQVLREYPDWQRDAPGAPWLDFSTTVSITGLAASIRPDFLVVARRIDAFHPEEGQRPGRFKHFLRDHFPSDVRQRWPNEQGEACYIRDLLPPHDVIMAMFKSWPGRNELSRCRPLENFIGRTLTRRRVDRHMAGLRRGLLPAPFRDDDWDN